MAETSNDPVAALLVTGSLTNVLLVTGRGEEAVPHLERALLRELAARGRDDSATGWTRSDLSFALYQAGRYSDSREQSIIAVNALKAAGYGAESANRRLADADRELGDYAASRSHLVDCLSTNSPEGQAPEGSVLALESFAYLAVLEQQFARAATLLGAAEALRERTRYVCSPAERVDYDRYLMILTEVLSANDLRTEWDQGRGMGKVQALEFALGDAD